MNNLIELEELIPSPYVREYISKVQWLFTDDEMVVLSITAPISLDRKITLLKKLTMRLTDDRLKTTLSKFIDNLEKCYHAFKENSNKRCIYAVVDISEDEESLGILGYCPSYIAAYNIGKDTGRPFRIDKYRPKKRISISNVDIEQLNGSAVASLTLGYDGLVTYIASKEIVLDDETAIELGGLNRFFEVPNPFDRGDIVKVHGINKYGVVSTSQKDWREYIEEYNSLDSKSKSAWEMSDIRVQVYALQEENGLFQKIDINPIYLNIYRPRIIDDSISPLDELLLITKNGFTGKLDHLPNTGYSSACSSIQRYRDSINYYQQ